MLKIGGNQKLIVGYDLGWDYAQISFCNAAGSPVETVSSVAGSEYFSIPTVLCKRPGVNQWFYGKEALQYAQENQGILVENLLQLAVDGESVQIDGGEYDPVALLTLFFKRSLGMLSSAAGTEKIEALMITCDQLDATVIAVLEKLSANLRLKTERIAWQSHQESYYDYLIHQQGELWKEPSILFHYQGNRMICYRMEFNRKTKPVVTFIHREEEEFPSKASLSGKEQEGNQILDRTFLELVQEKIGNGRIASVYLIGDDFSEDWLKESLKFLCDRRRIFLGNNLFCKGACHGMLEHFHPSDVAGEYVFLGEDKLKSNIGMNVFRQGSSTYLPLLDAGTSWKKATTSLEFYLKGENVVELTATSLVGGGKTVLPIELDGLSGDMARIRMTLYVKGEKLLHARFADLGFGEFRSAETRVWEKDVTLD
ncbi:MAG: hypothetical protein IK081_04045 [Lachnospiraceae bacterium]|nr:hypothetical protein [Lachnospiraceae bacterium]